MFNHDLDQHHPTDAERQEAVSVFRLGSEHTPQAEADLREALAALRRDDEQIERALAADMQDTVRQMLKDWESATPEERIASMQSANAAASRPLAPGIAGNGVSQLVGAFSRGRRR